MRYLGLMLLLVVGCGTSLLPPTARDKCRDFGLTQADYDSMIIACKAEISLGTTYGEMVHLTMLGCDFAPPQDQLACDNCMLAIVDMVYGD